MQDNGSTAASVLNTAAAPAEDTATAERQTWLQSLLARRAELDQAIAERRVEELKVLADGYAKKLQMNGFSIREGMDALKPYLKLRPSKV
jgi:hypothetical protein